METLYKINSMKYLMIFKEYKKYLINCHSSSDIIILVIYGGIILLAIIFGGYLKKRIYTYI